jgi:hypothetical protein
VLAKKYNIYVTIYDKCFLLLTIVLIRSGNGRRMSGVRKINNKRHRRLIIVTVWNRIDIRDF